MGQSATSVLLDPPYATSTHFAPQETTFFHIFNKMR